MARPWQYTRSRRTMMQLVMWLILGGTVGLAALVDRERANPQSVPLAPPIQFGYLEVRAPQGWRGARDRGQLVFQEPGADPASEDEDTGRVMVVEQNRGVKVPVDAYLLTQASKVGNSVRDATAIPMCGQRGILATVSEGAVLVDRRAVATGWSVLACTVLPSGTGVTVQLHTPRTPTGADTALVKAVARGLVPLANPAPLVAPRQQPEPAPPADGD